MENNTMKKKSAFTLAEVFHPAEQSRRNAFTLAEVLITLSIIGIVAALTMPALIQNHQKKSTAVQLRKAYAEMSQALKLAEVEYGEMANWDLGGCTDNLCATKYFFDNYLKLKFLKKCIPTTSECWSNTYAPDGSPAAFKAQMGHGGYSSVITASGYSLFSQIASLNNTKLNNIVVDINGKKGPNKLGRDVFLFAIRFENKFPNFYLEALKNNDEVLDYCTKDCSKFSNINYCGRTCGSKIERNGWEIPADYPW